MVDTVKVVMTVGGYAIERLNEYSEEEYYDFVEMGWRPEITFACVNSLTACSTKVERMQFRLEQIADMEAEEECQCDAWHEDLSQELTAPCNDMLVSDLTPEQQRMVFELAKEFTFGDADMDWQESTEAAISAVNQMLNQPL